MTATAQPTADPADPAGAPHARHFAAAMAALAVGGFAIGTTEFQTMGVLPQISNGVGVSISTAGHLISAYAAGVVVGVPILAFFVAGLPRKAVLVTLMGVYAAFNLLSAVAQSYHMLLLARFLAGLPHGAYFGVASLVAAKLARPGYTGRAVALVMLGLSVANVVGVPASTWMGEHLGWRIPYVVSAGLAALTAVLVLAFVPHFAADKEATGRREAREFFVNGQVWLTMVAGAAGFGGMFAVYSYIAPIVTNVSGLHESAVPWFVLAFGLGMVLGTWIAGELARWSVFGALVLGSSVTIAVLVVYWLVSPHGWWLLPINLLVTTVSSWVAVTLQIRLMEVAGNAVTLGAAMNHAALNLANALGAWLGGVALDQWGERSTSLVGAVLAVIGVAILVLSVAVRRRTPPAVA